MTVNYFAHGCRFVQDPYFLAGTAVPDWLGVVNRKARARARLAQKFVDDHDARVAALARGIVQHYHDDHWFHGTQAFMELTLQLTVGLREVLLADDGFRPSFLGHILVELLLDAALIEQQPGRLDAYYQAVATLDADEVNRSVNRMATHPTGMLAFFIPRFSAERFLYDYLDDRTLLMRLNDIMRRVRLPPLPESLLEFLPDARRLVKEQKAELLAPQGAHQWEIKNE